MNYYGFESFVKQNLKIRAYRLSFPWLGRQTDTVVSFITLSLTVVAGYGFRLYQTQ